MTAADVRDDRGAVIVIFTLLLVALLGLSAIVVDLGLARVERRENQSGADLAALDAGLWLSGRGAATPVIRPRAACEAALESVRTNVEGFPAGASLNCGALPDVGTSPACHGGTSPQTVVASGAAPFDLSVTYPVAAGQIVEASFTGGVGVDDGGQCERMEITVGRQRDSFFAGIFGVTEIQTEATAVVRGATIPGNDRVPAFLILSRTGCRVLANSAGGVGNRGIIVSAPSATQGGSVRTDTDASECGNNNADFGIYADPLSDGSTSLTIDDAASGAPGSLETYAVTVGNPQAAAHFPGGLSHPPVGSGITSRQPVDDRYNPALRQAIDALHAGARNRVMWSAATAAANGFTVLGCGDVNGTWNATRVFVDCASWQPVDVRLPDATDLVTTGKIEVANNQLLYVPVAERIYVRGCPTCNGGNLFGVRVAGEMYVNTGPEPIGSADCDNRRGPGAGGATTNITAFVIFGSPLDVPGRAYLCQTTLYLAGESPSYTRATDTFSFPNCTAAKPCPVSTGPPNSHVDVGGFLDWSAPNQTTSLPDNTHPLEDLALWTETSHKSQVKSGGVMLTSGVFFAPNGRMEFRSPASGLPRNAQLVVESFELLQGTLRLAPAPTDAVSFDSAGDAALIR